MIDPDLPDLTVHEPVETRIESLSLRSDDIRLYGLTPPQPPTMVIKGVPDGRTLATIHPDGRVEYDPTDLDEAARIFWDAVSRAGGWEAKSETSKRA